MHPLLKEGLIDATGFIGGTLLAYWGGKMLGFDPLADGYGGGPMVGILLAGLGGGAGVQLARCLHPPADKRD